MTNTETIRPNAYLITADSAEPVAHPLTLEAMQETVGGYITVAFTIEGPDGHLLTGYVNDEGLLIGLPIVTILDNGTQLAGPCLITGLDSAGDTVPLTDADFDFLEQRAELMYATRRDDPRDVRTVVYLSLDD
jgi:hypothetical protein